MTDQYQRLRREGLGWIGDLFKGINRRLTALEGLSPDQVGGTRQQIIVVDGKADTAQADALAAQSQALAATADALEAASNALAAKQDALDAQLAAAQAVLDAAQAQSEIDLGRQVDQSNLFDMRPILAKDATLFYTRTPNPAYVEGGSEPYYVSEVPNITAWFEDGFTITAPRDNYEIDLLNAVPYKAVGSLSTAVSFAYSHSGSWTPTPERKLGVRAWLQFEGYDETWAGYDYRAVASHASAQSGVYVATNPYGVSTANPNQNTWRPAITVVLPVAGESFTIRGVRLTAATGTVVWADGTSVPSAAIADDRIVRRMIAPGAVGPTELGSDVQFGPPSGGWQDSQIAGMSASKIIGSITNAMISALDAAKLTGTILLARLPAAITGRTSLGATDGQFTTLRRANGDPWVDTQYLDVATFFTMPPASSGYVLESSYVKRSGMEIEYGFRITRTAGLQHATEIIRLNAAYRNAIPADKIHPAVTSGNNTVSTMIACMLRSESNPNAGAFHAISPNTSARTIEFGGSFLLAPGT